MTPGGPLLLLAQRKPSASSALLVQSFFSPVDETALAHFFTSPFLPTSHYGSYLEACREALSWVLFSVLHPLGHVYREHAWLFLHQLKAHCYWRGSQLIIAFISWMLYLLGEEQEEWISQIVIEEKKGWAFVAQGPLFSSEEANVGEQIELATLWACLGYALKREDLLNAAARIARWQLHLLDTDFYPFSTLFRARSTWDQLNPLSENYLLLKLLCCWNADPYFAFWMSKNWSLLEPTLTSTSIPTYRFLLDLWAEGGGRPGLEKIEEAPLATFWEEPTLAMVGYRSKEKAVACTLAGMESSLGFIRFGAGKILAYGPQLLPLEESKGFGIRRGVEGSDRLPLPELESEGTSFFLKGYTRSCFPFVWLYAEQVFDGSTLCLSIDFLDLEGQRSFPFVFYVAADCVLKETGQELISPQSTRFSGEAQPLYFQKVKDVFSIKLETPALSMEVIPLNESNSTYGANYLVAYFTHPEQSRLCWKIGGSNRLPIKP